MFKSAAQAPVEVGPLTFTPNYMRMKEELGLLGHTCDEGINVLIVDASPPILKYLPEGLRDRVEILGESETNSDDGHGTLVTAIVADIAKGATIRAVGAGHNGLMTWQQLQNAFSKYRDQDVIVASIELVEGNPSSREVSDRDTEIAHYFRALANSPRRPLVIFPTGNDETGRPENGLAVPARMENVVAIGALGTDHRRAVGSRYGPKEGMDGSQWWLAPGGSFTQSEVTDPLVTMADIPHAGTSLAAAVAAGIAALAITRLRSERPPSPRREEVVRELCSRIPSENSLIAESRYLLLSDFDDVLRGEPGRATLLEYFNSIAKRNLVGEYDARSCGRGLLTFASGDTRTL
jgi:hypothetical protein